MNPDDLYDRLFEYRRREFMSFSNLSAVLDENQPQKGFTEEDEIRAHGLGIDLRVTP